MEGPPESKHESESGERFAREIWMLPARGGVDVEGPFWEGRTSIKRSPWAGAAIALPVFAAEALDKSKVLRSVLGLRSSWG